ncbi:NlpC/P60 family protein [Bengtsoniella intestinalis]|uniref:NlpC/P60 family protein n=1 Tax=Bengtsoniella intestinalis TaxID=3073143 RepID=UPI00391F619E
MSISSKEVIPIKSIKEKPTLPTALKEKATAAPKELSRQGRDLAISKLRSNLRDSAQQGDEQDSAVEIVADDVTDKAIHQGDRLVQRGVDKLKPKGKSAQPKDSPTAQSTPNTAPNSPNQPTTKPLAEGTQTPSANGSFSVHEPVSTTAQTQGKSLAQSRAMAKNHPVESGQRMTHHRADTTAPSRPVGRTSPQRGDLPKTRGANATASPRATVGQRGASVGRTASNTTATTKEVAKRTAEGGKRLAQTKQSAKAAAKGIKQATIAIKEAAIAVATAAKSTVALLVAGGSVTLVALLLICVVGIIIVSPLGFFFAEPSAQEETVSPSVAVGTVIQEFSDELEQLQTGYDTFNFSGSPPAWEDVLAVFCAYATTGDDAMTLATIGADQIDLLSTVFWDMTKIETASETISHEATDTTEAWTESILTLTITPRIPSDMSAYYDFDEEQNTVLAEMMGYGDLLLETTQSLSIGTAEAQEILANLPDNLDPEQQAIIEQALSLVGKVTYFWGGKSLVLGWDDNWGELREVTADGNSTSDMYLPYGLDCSGFVDWVFYIVTDGEYIIGHGGGVIMQHTYCTDTTWDEATPGDLVFYPDFSHVGIYAGEDEAGEPIIIHCSMGYNNVVITGQEGFTLVGRPDIYG